MFHCLNSIFIELVFYSLLWLIYMYKLSQRVVNLLVNIIFLKWYQYKSYRFYVKNSVYGNLEKKREREVVGGACKGRPNTAKSFNYRLQISV